MSDNRRNGRGVFGKGYYIALILCAAAIGITSYVYYRNQPNSDTLQASAPLEDTLPVMGTEDDIPVIATAPKQTEPTKPTQESTKPTGSAKLQTMSPVKGQTVTTYAMEQLSYNQTTRDWRVHNGMDIAAEEGTPVLAAADGEVYTVYEDDTMGHTVVIRHLGGYTTKYSSLAEAPQVKPGDKVTMGQTIGTVGTTALVETTLGPHVHFSVTFQDLPMDPEEFLTMN